MTFTKMKLCGEQISNNWLMELLRIFLCYIIIGKGASFLTSPPPPQKKKKLSETRVADTLTLARMVSIYNILTESIKGTNLN